MALEMAYATGDHRAALFVSGVLLTLVVAVIVWLASLANARGAHG
jgi:phosphate transport system permease protein